MIMWQTLADLFFHGTLWSFLAIGGANVTLADIQRYAVDTRHWVSEAEFVTYFSVAQAAPGPNGMAIVLIGLQAAGMPGALVSLFAKSVPSSIVAWCVSGWIDRRRTSPWVGAVKRGLAPITVGLFVASSILLVKDVDKDVRSALLTLACAAIAYRSRMNPVWIVAAGTALGLAGWLR
jgi:chromate transporter